MASLINFPTEIICGVQYNGKFSWYVSDRELWILDYTILDSRLAQYGYNIESLSIDSKRSDSKVLVKENAGNFLEKMTEFEVSSEDLQTYLLESIDELEDSWYYDFQPSLFIDFDDNRLYSQYSESESFEDYVPFGWVGMYRSFWDLIPVSQRFWIHNGINIFEINNK
ncbi:hypothetical protein AB1I63_00905 [Streptococcus pneumoniae]